MFRSSYGKRHDPYCLCRRLDFFPITCVLPLIPGYISIISGFSMDQLKTETRRPSILRAVFRNSLMFILGFSITFISLAASASWLGQVLLSKMTLLYRIAGLIIVVFGLHLSPRDFSMGRGHDGRTGFVIWITNMCTDVALKDPLALLTSQSRTP